jgi:serine/threonine protein kinase
MKRCPKCNETYADADLFCGNDGQSLIVAEAPASADAELALGGLLDGKYVLERELGSGGMGRVFAARHRIINKRVAIKVLKPDKNSDMKLPERFQQEAEAAARLRHPNLVAVHDFGQTRAGQLYMVMEFVDGHSLRDLLEREGRLTPARVALLGSQMCAGIAVAHTAGVIHRDLKPENVLVEMIDGRETARVFDFGIAKLLDREGLTRQGYVLGTPNYMSPEQASAHPVDNRSDIYSLGVMLYEMLAGDVPFSGDKPQQVLVRHVIEKPKPITDLRPDTPPSLASAVMRALAKNPDNRQQSATQMAQELSASVNSQT